MTILIFLKHFFINILNFLGFITLVIGTVLLADFLFSTFGPGFMIISLAIIIILTFITTDAWKATKEELNEKEEEK